MSSRDIVLKSELNHLLPTQEELPQLSGTTQLPFKPFDEINNDIHKKGEIYYANNDTEGMSDYAHLIRAVAEAGHLEFNNRKGYGGDPEAPMAIEYFNVAHEGGIAPAYQHMVNHYAEYKHEARFWLILSNQMQMGISNPTFDFHADYVEKYSNLLPPQDAFVYLFGVKKLLMEKKDSLPDQGREYVLSRVNKMIETKREIVTTAIEINKLKKILEEENGQERNPLGSQS